jgi:hypothetical protein
MSTPHLDLVTIIKGRGIGLGLISTAKNWAELSKIIREKRQISRSGAHGIYMLRM